MENVKPKGMIQISIGIIAGILLIIGAGSQIFSVFTEHSITSNRELLIKLGYDPDLFHHSLVYWIAKYGFHFFGIVCLLLYTVFVYLKNSKVAKVAFLCCLIYSLGCAIISITDLTPERRENMLLGGWIARIILWSSTYIIELMLLAQGLWGLQKYYKTSKSIISSVILPKEVPG